MFYNNGIPFQEDRAVPCWACEGGGRPHGCTVCGKKNRRHRLGTAYSIMIMGDERPRFWPTGGGSRLRHEGTMIGIVCPRCKHKIFEGKAVFGTVVCTHCDETLVRLIK
jgi:hypothetical protein